MTICRPYYHCRHCHQGCFPTDDELGLVQKQSRGAREVIALAGTLQPFDQAAATTLPRMAGLKVSASTVQRTTEAAGAELAKRRAAGETFGSEQPWDWHVDAQGKRVAYVSLDATGVAQQGLHGEKAEGRMPWVAAVFNPQPTTGPKPRGRRRIAEARYVSLLGSLDEVGGQLRRECAVVGVNHADVVVALTDGGNGLKDCLLTALAGLIRVVLVFILDFWHAAEHLVEFGQVLFPDEPQTRKKAVKRWRHILRRRGGAALLEVLERLDTSGASPAAQTAHRQLLNYIAQNVNRMDYPTYAANGWQIGSGVIESACKTVIVARMKGGGKRWRERGTDALAHLRALHRSERSVWRSFWASI